MFLFSVSPVPNCPLSFSPIPQTRSSLVTKKIDSALGPKPIIFIGNSFGSGFTDVLTLSMLLPSPSWPNSFLPHAPIDPSLKKMKVDVFIALNEVTVGMLAYDMGNGLVKFPPSVSFTQSWP